MESRKNRGAALIQALREKRAAEINAPTFEEFPGNQESLPKVAVGRAALLARFKSLSRDPGQRPASRIELETDKSDESTVLTKNFADDADSNSPTSDLGTKCNPSPVPEYAKVDVTVPPTSGTRTQLASNYLELIVAPGQLVYEYSVKFEPQMDYKHDRIKCIHGMDMKKVVGPIVDFDGGTRLHLPKKVADKQKFTVDILHRRTGKNYTVHVNFIRKKELGDNECIPLFNTIFRRIMHTLKMVQARRNFYDNTMAVMLPEQKLEIWPGLVTSVDNFDGGLLLQCDVSFRVLRCDTAYDVIENCRITCRDRSNLFASVKKALIGQVVMTKYNNKSYRVDDVNFEAKLTDTFMRNGVEMSFVDYFKEVYDIEIGVFNQPMIVHRPKAEKIGFEVKEKILYLVPTLCYMTGLTDDMRENFKAMKEIGAVTRPTPQQRQLAVTNFARRVLDSEEARKHLNDWGLTMSQETVKFEGRILPGEKITFGGNKSVVVSTGDFSRESKLAPMLTSVRLDNWVVIFPEQFRNAVDLLVKSMTLMASKLGMEISQPRLAATSRQANTIEYLNAIKKNVGQSTQLSVAVCPSKRDDRYGAIKKLCIAEIPHANQVVLSSTLQRKNFNDIVARIAMQINCKLGGELWACAGPYKNAMVVGIDVWHDSGLRDRSVAAIIMSMNRTFSRYNSYSSVQESKTELVDSLKVNFINGLNSYKEFNDELPDRVIVFRDGVGHGQLDHCNNYEVAQIKAAFKAFKDYKPKLTVVIVSKRVNTRFMSYAARNSNEFVYDNPPPGTIADNTITKRNWFNFYLVSQKAGQGTVTPTHFLVINNEGNMNPDQIQRLSYKLAHMYFNWPGTVRVPAPCLYADRLAVMVGKHVKKNPRHELSNRLYYL